MNFEWIVDKCLVIPSGNEIRILRRASSDNEEWRQDLKPFEEIPALWKLRMGDGADALTIGTLRRVNNSLDCEEYYILRDTGVEFKVSLPVPLSREVTAWRVNDKLDMLQVSVRCVDSGVSLYAQLGGATILPILMSEEPSNESLVVARSLFRSGELGEI